MTPRRPCLAASVAVVVTAVAAAWAPEPAWAGGPEAEPAAARKPVAAPPVAAPAASVANEAAAATPAASTSAKSATAATAADDPMDRLRQRLSDRLARGRGDALGGKIELRTSPARDVRDTVVRPVALKPAPKPSAKALQPEDVGHVSSAPALPRAGHAAAGAAAPRKAAGAAAVHGTLPHWGYEGQVGPAAWGGLRPEFALCGSGQRQSPIDIRDGLPVDLEPVRFEYQASRFAVVDNGHTVQVNVAPGNAIDVGGRRYELVQFHFHRPSEERIDGRQFEMSVHLVHKDPQGRLAVVAVLLDKGPAQPVVQTVWNNLPLEKHEEVAARVTIDPAALLPADRRYYTYMGSLTTPPCSEGVQWVVMRTPVAAAPEQVDLFSRIYPMNARPVQSASGRRILQSN